MPLGNPTNYWQIVNVRIRIVRTCDDKNVSVWNIYFAEFVVDSFDFNKKYVMDIHSLLPFFTYVMIDLAKTEVLTNSNTMYLVFVSGPSVVSGFYNIRENLCQEP